MFTPTANALLSIPVTSGKSLETTSPAGPGGIAQLSRRLAAGEEAAFREFHAAYFDRLYRFLLVLARGQEQDAQEALQQTFLRVVRYARAFESEEAFWDWLKVLARSSACDAGRKQQRYSALLEKFKLWRSAEVSDPSSATENRWRDALEESLAKLTAEERRLLEGKYLEGSTVKDLSAETGATEKAVESRLLRLRRQLRERLLQKLHST